MYKKQPSTDGWGSGFFSFFTVLAEHLKREKLEGRKHGEDEKENGMCLVTALSFAFTGGCLQEVLGIAQN